LFEITEKLTLFRRVFYLSVYENLVTKIVFFSVSSGTIILSV